MQAIEAQPAARSRHKHNKLVIEKHEYCSQSSYTDGKPTIQNEARGCSAEQKIDLFLIFKDFQIKNRYKYNYKYNN